MIEKKGQFILLCCILLICFQAYSKEYFVTDTLGMNEALNKVRPGDVILWKNGDYKDVHINFNAQGRVDKWIVFKAETAGKVRFRGNSSLVVNGSWLQVEGFSFSDGAALNSGDVLSFGVTSSHSRITNCAVINYSPADAMVNTNWMVLQGSYNEVDHCYFKGKVNQGPYLVVRYFKPPGYVDGSDQSPSTFHRIHHNYFGYRTLPSSNGGEDMRIGDSFTSFTHGFNIIEYNYFEDHRLEAEVISNKSCDNIYRFNTFVNNDGQLVLRHGENCFVYGNYFDGNSGRNLSGGIRIINANQTVFNNYISNVQGSSKDAFKAGIVIMSGLKNSPLNGYYAADNAIVAFNRLVDCETPVFKIGFGNKSKALPLVAPQNITLVNNVVVNAIGKNSLAIEYIPVSYAIKTKGFFELDPLLNKSIVDLINQRLSVHQIVLTEKEITRFDPSWKLSKEDVGVSWSEF